MSKLQRYFAGQIKHQQKPFKQSQQLKQSLMQKAKLLKQKMYQQTNYFDYSIDHLMSQTLKQIKKHKEQFKEKQQYLIRQEQSEQTKRKKSLLKNELVQNIQKCKNRYKKHITSIKNQRNRIYTENKQLSPTRPHNVEEMLITAKNRFKKEHRERRNHSEIIHIDSRIKHQVVRTHNPTHNIISPNKTPKLYQKLIKVNQDLTYILEDPAAFPQLNKEEIRQINGHQMNQRQIFGVISPMTAKKQIFLSTNTSKNIYYSPFRRFPTQTRQHMNNTQIDTLISQRSAFQPLGKVIRSQIKQLEINNSTKREQNIKISGQNTCTNKNRLSTEILNVLQERQQHQGNQGNKRTLQIQKETENSLPSNRLLAKQIKNTRSMVRKTETKRPNFLTQSSILQSQKMSRLKEHKVRNQQKMFQDIKGTRIVTEFTPKFKQSPLKKFQQHEERKEIKIDEQITGKISLGDSRVMMQGVSKDSIWIKGTTFQNSKFSGFNRGVKNRYRFQGDEFRESQLQVVTDYKKKLAKSINLDVRGNNVKLVQSIILQKSHKLRGSDFSQVSIL